MVAALPFIEHIMETAHAAPSPEHPDDPAPTSDTSNLSLPLLAEHGIVPTEDGLRLNRDGVERLITRPFSAHGVEAEDGMLTGIAFTTEPKPGKKIVRVVPMSDTFLPSQLMRHLIPLGIMRAIDADAVAAVRDYAFTTAPQQRMRLVEREGIVQLGGGRVIAVFDGQVTAGESNEIIVVRPQDSVFSRGGTHDGQQALLRTVLPGNPYVATAMMLGPAAAVAELVPLAAPSIHVVAHSTSTKSTTGRFLLSEYGYQEYLNTWDGTPNGFEAQNLRHQGVPCIYDEYGTGQSSHARVSIYKSSGSMSRSRMTTSGTLEKPKALKTLMYSTGEVSPREHAGRKGRDMKTGHEVRLVVIALPPGQTMISQVPEGFDGPKEFADYIASESAIHYGHFTQKLMSALVECADVVRQSVPALVKDTEARVRAALTIPPLDPVEARVFSGFVNLCAAARLAIDFDLFPMTHDQAAHAVGVVFMHWLGDWREVADFSTTQHATAWLRQNLGLFANIVDWHKAKGGPGFVLHHPIEGILYLVHREFFRDVICKDVNAAHQLRALRDAGLLATHSHNLTWGQRMPGAGAEGGVIPFYAIRAAALFEAQD